MALYKFHIIIINWMSKCSNKRLITDNSNKRQ